MADLKFKIIIEMFFLKISNADMLFSEKTLIWIFYITSEALPTIKQVSIIDPKKFIIIALNIDNKMFVVHVTIWE